MITLRHALTGGTAVLVALLFGLGTTVELGRPGWSVGLACGVLVSLAVGRGLGGAGGAALGPADLVTLSRVTVACGVAAVVATSVTGASSPDATRAAVVLLSAVALALDAVDGWTARRTGTASPFGARFDGEADAFLIMVLSVHVAVTAGAWVLAIGSARYLFGVAGICVPWLRSELPPRYWRKVVAAVQGVVLTWAAAEVAPPLVVALGLAVALALLAESFGRDVVWLWRRRSAATDPRHEVLEAGRPTAQAAGPRG